MVGALVNPSPITCYNSWREMLHGVWLVMIRVERCGGVDVLTVGILSRSSSGSTIGREWAVRLVPTGGLFGVLGGLGCRSWMWAWGVVDVMARMIDGLASALGGGMVSGLLDWRVGGGFVGWFAIWRVRRRAGGFPGRSLVGRLGGGTRGLQLLATTVTSLLSAAVGFGMGYYCKYGAGGPMAFVG
jgi:hypothetical protein